MLENKGILYIVATPIGNLEDMTFRAVRILGEVDLIAAEDTRQTLKLLNHYEIKKTLISYHEHNKLEKEGYLIEKLLEEKNIALVSDAGTPGISDPGEELIKSAIEKNITVTMIPGPAALIPAVVLSGFETGRFVFEGFLPANKKSRIERLTSLKDETRTMVFYEAPHRLVSTLKDILDILGDRRISLARELTKKFEEIVRCNISQAIEKYGESKPKGEFVLVVEGREEEQLLEEEQKKWENISIEEHYDLYIKQGLNKKDAMKKVAEDRGISRRSVYAELFVR